MGKMNIIFCTSEEFSLATYVLVQSIMENNPNFELNFYMVFCDDIANTDSICQFIEKKGHRLNVIKLDKEYFDQFKTQNKWTSAVFMKLLMHEYLPEEVERILYVDMDIVCDGNLSELYNVDLNDKYIAACANTTSDETIEKYNNMTQKDLTIAANGNYFNSGLILFNLKKIREDVSNQDILEAYDECLKNCSRYLADQSILNWMYCEKMVYLNPLDYNYRIGLTIKDKSILEGRKKAIVHYVSQNQPYKPWDIWLEDNEINQIRAIPFEAPYIYISKESNDLAGVWWRYAKQTPVYDQLYKQMLIKKKWFMVYGITTVVNIAKYIDENKKQYRKTGYIEEQEKTIRQKLKNKKTYLEALNEIYSVNYTKESLLSHKIMKKYLPQYLMGIQDKGYIIFMSVYHTSVGFWEKFLEVQELGLQERICHCEGYCAVVDMRNGNVIEKKGKGLLKIDYCINDVNEIKLMDCEDSWAVKMPKNGKMTHVSIRSLGYNTARNVTASEIYINNIDYSLKRRGLNFVVFDPVMQSVVDAFNVDIHGDEAMVIRRDI